MDCDTISAKEGLELFIDIKEALYADMRTHVFGGAIFQEELKQAEAFEGVFNDAVALDQAQTFAGLVAAFGDFRLFDEEQRTLSLFVERSPAFPLMPPELQARAEALREQFAAGEGFEPTGTVHAVPAVIFQPSQVTDDLHGDFLFLARQEAELLCQSHVHATYEQVFNTYGRLFAEPPSQQQVQDSLGLDRAGPPSGLSCPDLKLLTQFSAAVVHYESAMAQQPCLPAQAFQTVEQILFHRG